MSLVDTLRAGVKVLDNATKDLQSTVTLEHFTGAIDPFGKRSYKAPVKIKALVDWKQRHVRLQGGELSVSRAHVQFLDVDALAAATNGEGIADEDRITLQDGTTGPILDMGGFIDAGTGFPLATEVYLG